MTLYLLMICGHTALYKLQWMLHFRGSCILRLFNTDNGVKKLWTEVIFQYYLIPLSEGQFNKTVTSVAIVWESKTKATLVNYKVVKVLINSGFWRTFLDQGFTTSLSRFWVRTILVSLQWKVRANRRSFTTEYWPDLWLFPIESTDH